MELCITVVWCPLLPLDGVIAPNGLFTKSVIGVADVVDNNWLEFSTGTSAFELLIAEEFDDDDDDDPFDELESKLELRLDVVAVVVDDVDDDDDEFEFKFGKKW